MRTQRRWAVALIVGVASLASSVPDAAAATRSWTGGGASDAWSDAANWGGVAPSDGDDLFFPAGSSRPESTNDRAGAAYRSVHVGDARTITGSSFTIGQGGLRAEGSLGLQAPVRLGADQFWDLRSAVVHLGGTLDLQGRTLDLGTGSVDRSGAVHASSAIVGGGLVRVGPTLTLALFDAVSFAPVEARAGGSLQLFRGMVAAPVRVSPYGSVAGGGSVGGLVVDNGNLHPGSAGTPVLDVAGDLTLVNGTRLSMPREPGHRLRVSGRVHLADVALYLEDDGRSVGSARTILESTGSSPVSGSFAAIPEGGRFISFGVEYRITYRGGDGNDVVATLLRRGARPTVVVEDTTGVEGSTVAVRARVDPPSSDPVHFRLGTIGGLASSVWDYEPNHHSFTSVAHVAAVELPIALLDDAHRERGETIHVALALDEHDGVDGVHPGTVMILDRTPELRSELPGYRMVAADGGTFTFGRRDFDGARLAGAPAAIGIGSIGVTSGYLVARADGSTWSAGGTDRPFGASVGPAPVRVNRPIVGVAVHPGGLGYWMVADDGGVLSSGAPFHGSTGDLRLNRPIVGMAPTTFGDGYWLVASDGGIFSFGDAGFFGSTGDMRLNRPIVGMAATPSGAGYWLVASDGGIFSFGDAGFFGSTGDMRLNQPIVGMAATASGDGYWLVASDGGVFAFGDAPFLGSTGDLRLNSPIVAIAP